MSRRHQLKRLRRRLRWSQHETSKRSRIERTKLSLYENGHVPLKPEEEKRLEAALRIGLRNAAEHLVEELAEITKQEEAGPNGL